MSEKQKKLSISSKIEAIDTAVIKSVDFARKIGCSEEAIFGIDMAVREAVANAVKHGNKLDETKEVEITLNKTDDGLEIKVRDFGKGFDVKSVPDPTDPENLLKESGRGLLFMQNFVDSVEWHDHPSGGLIVKMIKNC